MVFGVGRLIIVLDSNEYIIFLNKKTHLDKILANNKIYINELIVKEVLRNIGESLKGQFYQFLFKSNIILHNEELPINLFEKYKDLGLKKGDIEIAAFCENINTDYLITENRHFLKSKKFEKIKVLNLKEFLEKVK